MHLFVRVCVSERVYVHLCVTEEEGGGSVCVRACLLLPVCSCGQKTKKRNTVAETVGPLTRHRVKIPSTAYSAKKTSKSDLPATAHTQ